MNHLLRTLTESQLEPTADLRLLLTSVKEGRKAHEQKLSDAFYDALEGLLSDLRMITVDNRDAEAFLKPVSRAEVPDYHDVISQPMDFQTMHKKVKQKAYKSKLEFQDDLNLIWTNCYTYNATENHPLRQCVKRLEQKANRLLQNITDRKDRMDPPLPSNLPSSSSSSLFPSSYSSSSSLAGVARPRINGVSTSISNSGSGSVNGISSYINGTRTGTYGHGHGRTPSGNISTKGYVKSFGNRRGGNFADTPAIVRTPEGMGMFRELSMGVDEVGAWGDVHPQASGSGRVGVEKEAREGELRDTLRELAPFMEVEVEVNEEDDDGAMSVDSTLTGGSTGEKRKLNGIDHKPRKRAKVSTQYPTPLIEDKDDFSQLWWGAVQSDALLANGLPAIPFGPASSKKVKVKRKKHKPPIAGPSTSSASSSSMSMSPLKSPKKPSTSTTNFTTPTKPKPSSSSLMLTPGSPMNISPTQTQSQTQPQTHGQPQTPETQPKGLLNIMNNNIKTMRRVRHTHAKFLALNAMTAPQEDEEGGEGGIGQGQGQVGSSGYGGAGMGGGGGYAGAGYGMGSGQGMGVMDDEVVDDKIDEEPWTIERSGKWNRSFGGPSSLQVASVSAGVGVVKGKGKGKGKDKAVGGVSGTKKKGKTKTKDRHLLSGVEMGEANASDCLHWTTSKVLEHVGFQGTSKVALDVFSDICGEYLSNVGRTIRFLTDKFGKTMTPEEIILHTLFESGSAKIQDLERYIKDDIERHGARLGELEKKLVSAYRETAGGEREMMEDEGLFDEDEDEEDAGALAFGDFADLLGEDYLGLRELGIAAESGLSNLTIPKKLLKGKKFQNKPTASKPTEPPPPYPPPPPFIPLTAAKVERQIGLLRPYYQTRFTALAAQQASVAPPPPPPGPTIHALPGPTIPGLPGPSIPGLPGPKLPGTAASNPNSLPSAPNTLPTAPNTLPSAPNALPAAPNTAPAPPPPPVPRPDLPLPDDSPPPAQVKMGPIGQIVRPGGGGGAGGVKKKAKIASTQSQSQSQSATQGGTQSQNQSQNQSQSQSQAQSQTQSQTQTQTQSQSQGSGTTLQSGVLPPAMAVPMSGVAALGMAGIPPPVGVGGGMTLGMGGGMGPVSYGMSAGVGGNGNGREGGSVSPVKKVKAGG